MKPHRKLASIILSASVILSSLSPGLPNVVHAATTYTRTYTEQKDYTIDTQYNKGFYMVPDKEGTYPVMFFFHGTGETKSDFSTYRNNLKDTLNKWIALGYMDPVVVVAPEIERETSNDSWTVQGNYNFVLKGRFATLKDKIANDELPFCNKVDHSKKLSVTGYSMGGAMSLYLGSSYPDDVINVGAGSPAQTYYQENITGMWSWMGKAENVKFTSDPSAHLFIAYGAKETVYDTNVNRYIKAFNANKGSNPNSFALYNTYQDGHTWNTFKREIFCFVYYMKFDKLPDSTTIEEACANTYLDYSTEEQGSSQENQQGQTGGNEQTDTQQEQQSSGTESGQTTGNDNKSGNNTNQTTANNNENKNTDSTSDNSSLGSENQNGSDIPTEYKNEWVNGRWYASDGSSTYAGVASWKCNSTGWWYEDTLGWYPTSMWQKIDGVWYYFNSSGYMASNEWVGGYWLSGNGSLAYSETATWKQYGSKWSYIDTSGWYPTSMWQKIDGDWYYFDGSGYIVTNKYVDGYYLGNNGVLQ